jgi:hypothetical protein
MKRTERRIKRHIISLRVTTEEWDSLHEIMQGLQFKRVSDLMREAFQLVLASPATFETVATKGQGDRLT